MPTVSKLGPHVLRPTAGAQALIGAGCRIVKLVGDFGLAVELANRPEVTVIGRAYATNPRTAEEQFFSGESPEAAAQRFLDSQRQQYALNPAIRLWEGHNEPVWSSREEMEWYARFEIERIKLLAAMGLRAVIGNFSTGNPDLSLWQWFAPAALFAKQSDGLLGLHEYSSPWMWWMTGKFQINPNEDQGDEGWVTLRYRKVLRQFLAPAGAGDVKIAITECGLDAVSPVPPGAPSGNWRTDAMWWGTQSGEGDPIPYWRGPERDGERYYAEQLIWYDRELQKDANVVGAAVFTIGSFGPPFNDYDIDGTRVVQFLATYIRENTTAEPPPVVDAGALRNGSFDEGYPDFDGWATIENGNQRPNGWDLSLPPKGQLLPFPTHLQQGNVIPAISNGPGELVHKNANQLPPDEQLGQPRALILDGGRVYKIFGGPGAHAGVLSQIIKGAPGATLQVTAFILGETSDVPTSPTGLLEPDHFVAQVGLGSVKDKRLYVDMVARHDAPDNDRAWNKFVVHDVFPADGQLRFEVIVQQNWPGEVNFFLDAFKAEVVTELPPPPVDLNAILTQALLVQSRVASLQTEVNQLVDLIRAAIGGQ